MSTGTMSSIGSAITSAMGTVYLLRSVADTIIPEPLSDALRTRLHKLSAWISSDITFVVDEFEGLKPNQVFEAASAYLGHTQSLSSSAKRLKVAKVDKDKSFALKIDKNEELVDSFDGANFSWMLCSRFEQPGASPRNRFNLNSVAETRRFELWFHRRLREMALTRYLPYVMERAKEIKEEREAVKLHTLAYGDSFFWSSVNLDHLATFETIAMNLEAKKALIDDLESFVARKDYYRRVGKAWKRGYLMFGPPGTGKSSLVAAIANHLKFDIYDLDLKEIEYNSDLRRILTGMKNRSILVIEDIDCSIDLVNRTSEEQIKPDEKQKISLSALLNFIDGIWSSCGSQRIVIFTTNHKERLDPALLRPGRMDLHLHMSYCDFDSFKTLLKNYLGIDESPRDSEIQELLESVRATPAEVAGELMKSGDAEVSLRGLVGFLNARRTEDKPEISGPQTRGKAKRQREFMSEAALRSA